jgi:hypothetical protein
VPRSKNEWSYTSTPQYAFIAWLSAKSTGTTLHFSPLIALRRIFGFKGQEVIERWRKLHNEELQNTLH